jgi:hypothetical protein
VQVNQSLLIANNWGIPNGFEDGMKDAINEAAAALITDYGVLHLPQYYRRLYDFESNDGDKPFREHLVDLLSNRLTLVQTAKAGEGLFKDYFLSGRCPESDLPWNTEEIDW